jgi:D-alanine-D-alanine ligase
MEETCSGAEDPFSAAASKPLDLILLYNATSDIRRGLPIDILPDADESSMAPVAESLRQLGHRVRTLGITYDTLHLLDDLDAQFVLNLCEGTGLDGNPGTEVITALERRSLPYSGVGPWCYWVTSDKWTTKLRLAAARVPVPCGTIVPDPDTPLSSRLRYPLFVKPRDGFGSLGVDEHSIAHNADEARRAIGRLAGEYGTDALVEHYIEGREITVAVIGAGDQACVLPPLEVQFGPAYRHKPQIRMFATKFDTKSELYYDFRTMCPAPLDAELTRRVKQVALRAYRAVGGDGYARVDMRLASDGTPYVLEVNGNCSIEDGEAPQDCGLFTLIGRALGWTYPELLCRLIGAGLMRRRSELQPPFALRWQDGRTATHALVNQRPGDRVVQFGPVYRAPQPDSERTLYCSKGCSVFVEPHVRHLAHDDNPNLRVVRDGSALWLEASRRVMAGDQLTLDRSQPLDLTAAPRCPRAYGRAYGRRVDQTNTSVKVGVIGKPGSTVAPVMAT